MVSQCGLVRVAVPTGFFVPAWDTHDRNTAAMARRVTLRVILLLNGALLGHAAWCQLKTNTTCVGFIQAWSEDLASAASSRASCTSATCPFYSEWTAGACTNCAPFFNTGGNFHPGFVDVDNDGDQDMLLGDSFTDGIVFYENTGTMTAPVWTNRNTNPAYTITGTDDPCPDSYNCANKAGGNGAKEACNHHGGTWAGTGWTANPDMCGCCCTGGPCARGPANGPFHKLAACTGNYGPKGESDPVFYDMDADGDQDLIIGTEDGFAQYHENVNGVYECDLAAAGKKWANYDPFVNVVKTPPGEFARPRVMLTVYDIDDDGDGDVLLGERQYRADGAVLFFENIGNSTVAKFVRRNTSERNPFHGIREGTFSAPLLHDFDNDGGGYLLVQHVM